MELLPISEHFYGNTIFGNDYPKINPDDKRITLGLFNFFGTLVWGEKGIMYSYERLILSSPFCKEKLIDLSNKGYTICVMDYVPKSFLGKYAEALSIFYQSVQDKITISFFAYTKRNISYIFKGLKTFFTPLYDSFGINSFYCGDDLDSKNPIPWYRGTRKDIILANELNLILYEPHECLGCYEEPIYEKNILFITCGQDFSGMELELESFRMQKERDGILLKYKRENNVDIYAIDKEELFNLYPETISIKEDESFIIFGNNPTLFERNLIRAKFIGFHKSFVRWYSRPSYKKISTQNHYKTIFENPLLCGELFVRAT